jgi:hypothetical protein
MRHALSSWRTAALKSPFIKACCPNFTYAFCAEAVSSEVTSRKEMMTDNFIGAACLSKSYQNSISLTDISVNYYTIGVGFDKIFCLFINQKACDYMTFFHL